MDFSLASSFMIYGYIGMLISVIAWYFAQKPIREAQAKKLQEIFSGDDLQKKKADILAGQYEWIDVAQNERWLLKEKEVAKILHQYHPDLSVHVYRTKVLIYHLDTK